MQTVRKLAFSHGHRNFDLKFRGIWPFKVQPDAKIRILIDRFRATREFSHDLHDF